METQQRFDGKFFYQSSDGKRVETQPEDLDRILRAVKEELENALRASGAIILHERLEPADGPSEFFRLEYEEGDARGTIEASAKVEESPPRLTSLTIRINETAVANPGR